MGKPSIKVKLNNVLAKGDYTEVDVVYILIETRKIIKDHDNQSSSFPILSFFCDWIAHAKMEYKSAKRMLDNIQDFYRGLDQYVQIKKQTSFFPFVMLIVLRKELKRFLEINDLPLALVTEDNRWEDFIYLLIDVIIDCPLITNSGYIREFRFIDYEGRGVLKCELKLQDGNIQPFMSKDKFDFIEKEF